MAGATTSKLTKTVASDDGLRIGVPILMTSPGVVEVTFDEQADVLYLKSEGAKIVDSSEDLEPGVILNYNVNRVVVGAQILDASSYARRLLGRNDLLPFPLQVAVARWLAARSAG